MKRQILFFLLVLPGIHGSGFAQSQIRDMTFLPVVDSTLSQDVDWTTIPDRVILKTGTNTNLALNKPVSVRYNDPTKISNHVTAWNPLLITDGRLAANSFFELVPGQEGTQIMIDLQAIRIVNRVRTRVYPSNNTGFRVQGYSISVGLDSLSFKKVKQVPDNDLANTDDFFDPDTARYLLFTIDKMDPVPPLESTTMGELEVYGTGYLSSGTFVSKVRDAVNRVNWARLQWTGVIPAGTRISMQARTGDSPFVNSFWSPWSDTVSTPNSLFTVFEPRRYMQYRVNLETFSIETPQLTEVIVAYDSLLVMQSATATVSPQVTPILKEALFQYEIRTQSGGQSLGVDSLIIHTDVPFTVPNVTVDGFPVSHIIEYFPKRVRIGFGSTISSSASIVAQIKFTPFLLETRFPAEIVSNGTPANPQRVDYSVANNVESWTIITTGVPEEIVVSATADPNPFTPNGDGRNDITYFSFFVSNLVSGRPLRIKIYDVTGRLVRSLVDMKTTAAAFVEQNAIPWDGRDDRGKILPPGLYLYQIYIETDGLDPAVVTKTVSLAY